MCTGSTDIDKRAFLIKIIEKELSKRKTFDEKVALIDAFLQFSQNPTSATAGFAIEENIERIKGNIEKRFKISQKAIENIVNILRHFATKAKDIDPNFYSWFSEIKRYLKEAYLKDLLTWREKLYEKLDYKQKEYFMFLLHALLRKDKFPRTIDWFKEYFDLDLPSIELENMLIKYGLADILFFRHSHHKYEMEELRLFAFLQELPNIKTFKNPLTGKDVEVFLSQLTVFELKYLEEALKKTWHPTIYFGGEGAPGLFVKLENKLMYSVGKRRQKLSLSPFIIDFLENKLTSLKMKITKDVTEKTIRALNSLALRSPEATLGAMTWQYVFDYEGAHGFLVKYTLDPREIPLEVGVATLPYIFHISHQETISYYIEEKLRTPYKIIFVEKEPMITLIRSLSGLRGIITIFLKEKDKYVLMQTGITTWLRSPHREWYSIFLKEFIEEIKRQGIEVSAEHHLLVPLPKFPRLEHARRELLELEPYLRNILRQKLKEMYGSTWIEELYNKVPGIMRDLEIKCKKIRRKITDILDCTDLGTIYALLKQLKELDILEPSDIELLRILKDHRNELVHLKEEDLKKDLEEEKYRMIIANVRYIKSKLQGKLRMS